MVISSRSFEYDCAGFKRISAPGLIKVFFEASTDYWETSSLIGTVKKVTAKGHKAKHDVLMVKHTHKSLRIVEFG